MLPLLILVLSYTTRVYSSEIVARGDTAVVFGQDASLSCTLPFVSGVKQVTWQRVRAQDVHTLATFSERFKDNVDEDFVGKIIFQASFNSTTIEIKNTTFEDEACYICSFKVYPTGPKRETLCVTVKGISEITAAVNPADTSDPDVVVSCSATGKPAPTIQWKSTEQELKHFRSDNFTTHNNDSSTTVTSNITLPLSQFHGKYVECLAQSDDYERSETIYIPRQQQPDEDASRNYIITFSVLAVMAVVVILITVIFIYYKRKRDRFGLKSSAEKLHDSNEEC
ncbi:OX-2 membrane glycoprotein-like [Danio aesculapii]|uniref:OX-2 membrane glycoprotein-like n=1 Tax=Danio aesculapii TaxID=1142201 RepID=UPI0024C04357|nr:OX-2 membrane glycoprotein-like [Danio aesculapii]